MYVTIIPNDLAPIETDLGENYFFFQCPTGIKVRNVGKLGVDSLQSYWSLFKIVSMPPCHVFGLHIFKLIKCSGLSPQTNG